MRPSEVEAWALRVLERVSDGADAEDSRVELKAAWPDPKKAARQIAGHANAARGTEILWLIGVDEKQGVIGAEFEELSNWLHSMEAEFSDLSPSCFDLNVPLVGKTVVALVFETDRAPFAVRNPVYGTSEGGPVQLEVPWREGRSVRSARRSDLIRILEPLTHLPTVEVLDGWIFVDERLDKETDRKYFVWDINVHTYFIPTHGESVVVPFHKCFLESESKEIDNVSWSEISLYPPKRISFTGSNYSSYTDSLTIESSNSEVIIAGPGRLTISARAETDSRPNPETEMLLRATLQPVGAIAALSLVEKFVPVPINERRDHIAYWHHDAI